MTRGDSQWGSSRDYDRHELVVFGSGQHHVDTSAPGGLHHISCGFAQDSSREVTASVIRRAPPGVMLPRDMHTDGRRMTGTKIFDNVERSAMV